MKRMLFRLLLFFTLFGVNTGNVQATDVTTTDAGHLYNILSTTDVTYEAIISKPWVIGTAPYGTEGAEPISNYTSYLGQAVSVIQEKVTEKATYALISVNGLELGWIDVSGLTTYNVLSTQDVNYWVEITKAWSINTEPWGTRGYSSIANYQSYAGLTVQIIQEKVTEKNTYGLIAIDDVPLGWIDVGALTGVLYVLESYPITYEAEVTAGWSINTEPWGTPKAEFVKNATDLIGKQVSIISEAITEKATYALVVVNGAEVGWIDTGALNPLVITSITETNYYAKLAKPWSINTQPWGTAGYQVVSNYLDYANEDVQIVQEAVTRRATYALISYNGSNIGWVDKGALEPYIPVTSSRTINYEATFINPWAINSQPWGTVGSYSVANPIEYIGKQVTVTQEKVTPRATYSYIKVNGKEIGWVDSSALDILQVQSTKNINYAAKIINPWALTNVPWGTAGYYNIADSNNYVGSEVTITQEKVTQKATYAYISYNGRALGWIDKTALDVYRVTNTKSVNYKVKITRPWTINTQPWGTEGFVSIPNYASYVGREVLVTQEATTTRGAKYAYLMLNGAPLGWIETSGVSDLLTDKFTVFIDPGHGGSDPGAQYFGIQEKKINLEVSKKIQSLLIARGYEVIMSRTTDTALDYSVERSKMANGSGADIFVSVHHNAMPGNGSVNGIETFYYEYDPNYPSKINQELHNNPTRIKESAELAQSIHSALIRSTGAFNRGVRRDTFAVLRETEIPAVLLELGFMSNESELKKLTTDSYQNTLAKAVVDGIDAYFK